MRREEVVRENLPIGQGEQQEPVTGKEPQFRAAPLKFAGVRCDNDVQALVRARRFSERESRGATVELTPLDAPLCTGGNRWFQQ